MIGARVDVPAHVYGVVCLDPPLELPTATPTAARPTNRARLVAAPAPTMASLTAAHARRS